MGWAYYGGRSIVYLFGTRYLLPYKIIYCILFFVASFADTTIIWVISTITVALMAIPNLVGILLLHKDVKITLDKYINDFRRENLDPKI